IAKKRTVCTGYAYLVRELALQAGLSCVRIDGYGRAGRSRVDKAKPNHSWSAIQLNHRWYLCDPTWSSGVIEGPSKKFLKKYDSAFFLADPSQFAQGHYPLDTSWMLLKKKPTLDEFLNRPIMR